MLRATESLAHLDIRRPTLLLDAERVRRNILRMSDKARESGLRFRPHFKTHQSATIGEWFRDAGTAAITVSSVDMALYFAHAGWVDITVAFPLNVREFDAINELAERIRLHVVVDSNEALRVLETRLTKPLHAWLKIDVGGRRAGVPWNDLDSVTRLASRLRDMQNVHFEGLLTHAGHSYDAPNPRGVHAVHRASVGRMTQLRAHLNERGIAAAVSVGDTPCCSVAHDFEGIDEIRPGNFVFYDVTQVELGSCAPDDVAVAVACPVVGKHPERGEVVLYGGAVHLSKDRRRVERTDVYGYLASWGETSWRGIERRAPVTSLSQEHGLVRLDTDLMESLDVGDLVLVLPAHSCLTTDLYGEYCTLDGTRIARRRSNDGR